MVRKGTKMSKESCDKMSRSHLDKVPWNKGIKNPYSEDTIKKTSESISELWKNHDYRNQQMESRNNSKSYKNRKVKQSITMKKLYEDNPEKGEENSICQKNRWKNDESFRERHLECLSKSRKGKRHRSSIEIKFEDELKNQNISYISQMKILNRYIVDFLIEDNIIIETDGNYWHHLSNIIEKDKVRDKTLIDNGFIIFRFWEHEINDNVSNCVKKIKDYIAL